MFFSVWMKESLFMCLLFGIPIGLLLGSAGIEAGVIIPVRIFLFGAGCILTLGLRAIQYIGYDSSTLDI